MTTYRELVYMCLDELHLLSDDATIEPEHILYLANKYRASLLRKEYSKGGTIPQGNYQTVSFTVTSTSLLDCRNNSTTYLKSSSKVPVILPIINPTITVGDYYDSLLTYVNKERFKFVSENKYLKNIIYASIDADRYLYLKSANFPTTIDDDEDVVIAISSAKVSAVFENPVEAYAISNPNDDIMDLEVPVEDDLINPIIQAVVQEISNSIYRPSDSRNNSNDDLSNRAVSYATSPKVAQPQAPQRAQQSSENE